MTAAARERELRRAVLASLADGDLAATRHELEVLADWWEEVGDVRAAAVRAALLNDPEWSFDASDRIRTTLSAAWASPTPQALHAWRGPHITVWTASAADPKSGLHDVEIEVVVGGEPFSSPRKQATSGTMTLTAGDADPLTLTYDVGEMRIGRTEPRAVAGVDWVHASEAPPFDPERDLATVEMIGPAVEFSRIVGNVLQAGSQVGKSAGGARRARRRRACGTCRNSGWLAGRRPCPACRGGK